ncbi:MAG: replication-relaxation family protein [Actinomycetota bacterium]
MYRARVESLLDERDHAILLSLLEHKVLTTDQIKSLFFRSIRRCQHRLRELKDLGVIAPFTPRRGFAEGRPPACWFLTKTGLSEIADAKGVRLSDLPGFRTRATEEVATSPIVSGSTRFFCALVEASKAHEDHCLATWRPEPWVRTTTTAEVKPDGFGRYMHPAGACEFYLEYDRGTEAVGALSRKLEGYLRLAAGWTEEREPTGFPNLLVLVPEEVREGEVGPALHFAVGRLHVPEALAASFPLYAAGEDALTRYGVLAPTWNHLLTETERLSLVELPPSHATPTGRRDASAATSLMPFATDGVVSPLFPLPHDSPCSRPGCRRDARSIG